MDLRNNLPKINDGTYLINLDEHKSIGAHWWEFIALCINGDNESASYDATYFDRFGVNYIPK